MSKADIIPQRPADLIREGFCEGSLSGKWSACENCDTARCDVCGGRFKLHPAQVFWASRGRLFAHRPADKASHES